MAPVVYEGLDEAGKILNAGVREWIKWIGEKSGRGEIGELSETGGVEYEEGREERVIWKPSFMLAHGQKAGLNVLQNRGNTLTLIRDVRVEWELKGAGLAKEIQKMMVKRDGKETDSVKCGEKQTKNDREGQRQRMETDSEKDGDTVTDGDKEAQRHRDHFDRGVSIEGEFSFVRAVGNFCKKSVRAGSFKGNYNFNVKQQMEMRELVERKGGKREDVTVVLEGGSQMGRLAKELDSKQGVGVLDMVRVKGKVDDGTVDDVLDELAGLSVHPDKVVIGGPTNSLVEHGEKGLRGFGSERQVRIRRGVAEKETEWVTRFHMTAKENCDVGEKRSGGSSGEDDQGSSGTIPVVRGELHHNVPETCRTLLCEPHDD